MDEVPGSIPGVDRFVLDGNGVGHGVCLLIAYAFMVALWMCLVMLPRVLARFGGRSQR